MFPSRWLLRVEAALIAISAVAITWILAAPGDVPTWERSMFERLNGLPDGFFPVLWLPMQFGGLVGAFVVVAIIAAVGRRLCAVTYAGGVVAGWLLAVAIKQIVERGRPFAEGLDAVMRGGDSTGFGFISGHATVAFAGATVVLAFFGPRVGAAVYALAIVAALARIYVGAHLPLDVIGGAAAGVLVGSAATYVEARLLQRRIIARLERGPEPPVQ